MTSIIGIALGLLQLFRTQIVSFSARLFVPGDGTTTTRDTEWGWKLTRPRLQPQ